MIAMMVVSAAMTYKSMQAQSAAVKQQKSAQQTQLADQAAQRAQEIRDQYRQQRIKSAEIAQSAANTGTQFSSGEIGGTSALSSTIANNVSSIQRAGVTSSAIGADEQNAANFMARANTYSAIGGLAGEVGSLFGSTPSAQSSMMGLFGNGINKGLPKSMGATTNGSGSNGAWPGAPYA